MFFFSVGMFYLWVCAANLPIVINEMEREEQEELIKKLQQLLVTNQRAGPRGIDTIPFSAQSENDNRNVFIVPRRKIINGFNSRID